VKSKILAALAATVLAACGGGSDGPAEKSVFSIWTNTANGATVDLSVGKFGTEAVIVAYTPAAARCLCRLGIFGTEQSGSFGLTTCIVSPYNAKQNPQCVALNNAGNYTKADGVLTLTTTRVVATYR
jgi:hypothetical protein